MRLWKKETTVRLIKQTPTGIIFAVRHGKRLLREQCAAGLYTLTWQDTPLIRLWPDECPTCAGMVSAGFDAGSNGAAQFLSSLARWNAPFVDLATSFSHLEALFTLLPSGYYSLEDRTLYPSDGNGHFFWAVPQQKTRNPATVSIWDRELEYHTAGPLYLLPTQSPAHFNPARADFYRDKPDIRAIAWYFTDSWLCALLDGHHKACAAALEQRPLKSLVIAPAYRFYDQQKRLEFFNGQSLSEAELIKGVPPLPTPQRLTPAQAESLRNAQSQDAFPWPAPFTQSAASWPDISAAGAIVEAGDLSEQRVRRTMDDLAKYDHNELRALLQALYYTQSSLFMPFACLIAGQSDADLRYQAYSLLAQRPCRQVDDVFVEFLIDDDGYRPDFTQLVDDYFRQRALKPDADSNPPDY